MPPKHVTLIEPELKTYFTSNTTAVIRPTAVSNETKLIEWAKKMFVDRPYVATAVARNVRGQARGFGTATTYEIALVRQMAKDLHVQLNIS